MHDVLIIGGGVIGLSLAWDLARHGRRVRVIDKGQVGREASWAGAGILPAANLTTAIHPYDRLCGLASRLHPEWAALLQSLTGIDTGYRRCGGLYLARTPGEAAALAGWAADQRELGIDVQRLGERELAMLEPGIRFGPAFRLPEEAQLRNPRYLKALAAACLGAGVELSPDMQVSDVVARDAGVSEVLTAAGPLRARQFCFTAGAWTGQLLSKLGLPVGILPMRGQMVLFRCHEPPMRHIVNHGSRYIVPRDDGYVLAGSTEEEVGFDMRTTDEAIAELTEFASALVPALASAKIERTWAGLRPASLDGFPYLGQLPGLANAFVAAGHFRSGLFLSPATAVVMSELIRGEIPRIDLTPFRVTR